MTAGLPHIHISSARIGALLMLAGIALLPASLLLRNALPAPHGLRPELRQLPTHEQPFATAFGSVTYAVKPLADYENLGLGGEAPRHERLVGLDPRGVDVVNLCVAFAENATKRRACRARILGRPGRLLLRGHVDRSHPAVLTSGPFEQLPAGRTAAAHQQGPDVRLGDQVRIRG